jgi:hypothetical protein
LWAEEDGGKSENRERRGDRLMKEKRRKERERKRGQGGQRDTESQTKGGKRT